eukprot:12266-Hanusia_phi.AAC.1
MILRRGIIESIAPSRGPAGPAALSAVHGQWHSPPAFGRRPGLESLRTHHSASDHCGAAASSVRRVMKVQGLKVAAAIPITVVARRRGEPASSGTKPVPREPGWHCGRTASLQGRQ